MTQTKACAFSAIALICVMFMAPGCADHTKETIQTEVKPQDTTPTRVKPVETTKAKVEREETTCKS